LRALVAVGWLQPVAVLVLVVALVVVVVVAYQLKHKKIKISRNTSTLLSRLFVGTDYIENRDTRKYRQRQSNSCLLLKWIMYAPKGGE
jgi:hypothetical protein